MAARSLGNLTVDLLLKESQFISGWSKAERAAFAAQKKMEADARSAAKAMAAEATAGAKQTERVWREASQRVEADASRMAGMTKRQYDNALRGVPAQITDIVVSLQGGQAPLTVLLQQGGQLRDMFGGITPAVGALAKGFMGLVNPVTLAGAAVATLGAGFLAGREESQQFLVALEKTGYAAETSVEQLNAIAASMGQLEGVTRGKAAEALTIFATGAGVGADRLERYTTTAVAWEKATGQAAEEVAKNFKKIGDDPLKGIRELDNSMNFLTASTYAQIRALQQAGDTTAAARVAQDAYDQATKTAADNIKANLGTVERAWLSVVNASKWAIDAVKDIGRTTPQVERLSNVVKEIAQLQKEGVTFDVGTDPSSLSLPQRRLASLKEEEIQLQKNIVAETNATKARAATADAEKTRKALADDAAQYMGKSERKLMELAAAEKKYGQAAKENAEAAKQYAAIRAGIEEKYKEAAAPRPRANLGENAYQTLLKNTREAAAAYELENAQVEKLTASQKLKIKFDELETNGKKGATAATRAQLAAEIERLAVLENTTAETKKAAAARAELAKAFEAESSRVTAESDRNEQLREEIELIGRSADEQYEVQRLRVEETLLIKQQHAAELDRLNTTNAGWSRQRALLESEIQLLEERLGLMDSGRARQKAADSWKVQQEQGEKAMDSIVQSFTDGLINGTQSFSQLLKNTVFTVAVRPLAEGVIGSLTGSGGGSGIGDTVGQLGNLYKLTQSALLQDFGSAMAGQVQQIGGQLFSNGFETFGSSVVDFGNTMAGFSDAINVAGDIFGYGSAIWNLSEGKIGSAAGSAIGTYFGGPVGAMIGSTLGGLVDGMFGGGTPHAGAASQYAGGQIIAGGKQFTRNAINADYTAGLQGSVDSLAFTLGSTLDGLDKIFGGQGGFSVTTGFKADSDDPSNATLQISNAVGDTLVKWLAQRSGEFGSRATGQSYDSDPEKGFDEYLKAITAATIPQFKAIVPAWADAMLDSFGKSIGFSGNASDWESISVSGGEAMQALQQVAAQIAQVEQAFASLGETLPMFANISDDVKSALLGSLGGMEGFGAAANSFYENFYSEAERMARAADRIKQATGIDPRLGEQAKEQFRSTVEEALQGGNGALAAQMLSLSDAFATAADYAQQLGSAAGGMSKWLREPLIALESQLTGGFDRKYISEDTSRGVQSLLSSVGVESDAGELAKMMLTATSAEVEQYFREVWDILPTEEANLKLVGLTESMLQLAEATDAANAAVLGSYSQAWDTLGAASNMAAQFTGNASGLEAQLEAMRASYAGADDPQQRAAVLQQITALEQGIFNTQQANRAKQAEALQEQNAALQEQLSNVTQLVSAARGLRDFVEDLRTGDLSGRSESGRMTELQAQYAEQLRLAQRGDVDALGDLPGLTSDLLSLTKDNAASQSDFAFESARMAAELEATGVTQEAKATAQEKLLERQITQNEARLQALNAQFEVSYETKNLINSLLVDSAVQFEDEKARADALLANGAYTNEMLATLPGELSAALGSWLAPALRELTQATYASAITAVPQYAVGTPYVPHDQLAMVHEGEMIVPKAYNPNAGGSSAGLMSGVIEDNRASSVAMASLLNRIARKLDQWDGDGLPESREGMQA